MKDFLVTHFKFRSLRFSIFSVLHEETVIKRHVTIGSNDVSNINERVETGEGNFQYESTQKKYSKNVFTIKYFEK